MNVVGRRRRKEEKRKGTKRRGREGGAADIIMTALQLLEFLVL